MAVIFLEFFKFPPHLQVTQGLWKPFHFWKVTGTCCACCPTTGHSPMEQHIPGCAVHQACTLSWQEISGCGRSQLKGGAAQREGAQWGMLKSWTGNMEKSWEPRGSEFSDVGRIWSVLRKWGCWGTGGCYWICYRGYANEPWLGWEWDERRCTQWI